MNQFPKSEKKTMHKIHFLGFLKVLINCKDLKNLNLKKNKHKKMLNEMQN